MEKQPGHSPQTPEDVAQWLRDMPPVQQAAVQAVLDERYHALNLALDLIADALYESGLPSPPREVLPLDGGRALLDALGKCLPAGPSEL